MLSNSRRLDESSLHLTGVLKRRGENIGTHPVEGGDAEGCSYKPRDPQDRWEPPESEEEARKLPPLEPAGERALLTPRLQTFSFQNCERIRFCGFCTQHVILCTAALKSETSRNTVQRTECARLDLGLRARRGHFRNLQQVSSTYVHFLERQTPST